jgi:chaperonin GroES
MAKLKPLYDKIVVRRFEEQEQKTPSGIIIPDTAKEKPQMGEVIAVGEGKLLNNGEIKPLKVKEGDVVLFNKYAGTEVELDGEKYLVMSEDEVLAIVEDAKVTT